MHSDEKGLTELTHTQSALENHSTYNHGYSQIRRKKTTTQFCKDFPTVVHKPE